MRPVRITSTARKHGLTRTRILAALADAELVMEAGDRLYFIGTDNTGVELEMIVVPDDRDPERLACTHAMPTHYRKDQRP